MASRKLDACEAAAEEVRASTGRHAVAVACHVGHWQECDALIESTLSELGRLDVLVDKAGRSPLYESLDAVTQELWDRTVAVNLKGPFRLATRSAGHMAAHDGGSVISVGTAGSLMAAPFVPLGRTGLPEEIAPLAVHLAGEASSCTTGAIVRVDGGVTRKV